MGKVGRREKFEGTKGKEEKEGDKGREGGNFPISIASSPQFASIGLALNLASHWSLS